MRKSMAVVRLKHSSNHSFVLHVKKIISIRISHVKTDNTQLWSMRMSEMNVNENEIGKI